MMKYQCDVRLASSVRCPRQAAMAFDKDRGHGREMFLFCLEHAPTDWSDFQAAYRIENNELIETGISRHQRELKRSPDRLQMAPGAPQSALSEVGEAPSHEYVEEAVRRHQEKKYDALFMQELRIRWP